MARKQPKASPARAPQHFDRTLRSSGARPTRQRRALYASLAARNDHPTAEALHREVRRHLPGLSLATVYTSLEVMAQAGLVGRVQGPDGIARYDARIDAHDHRRCLRCGSIEDLERPASSGTLQAYATPGFRATGFHIEVVGHCAACQAAEGETR
jgi:Fur family transcriptional regulator, peroxide stress response regulator